MLDIIPVIKQIEHEKIAYIKEMKQYLYNLKQMPKNEARNKAQINLIESNIIQKNGEFSQQYKYSREIFEQKG